MSDKDSLILKVEREHWSTHVEPYVFYDDSEYELVLELLGRDMLPGKRLLEIGCGAGLWTSNFARLGAQVYNFDLSVGIVATARQAADPIPVYGFVADMHALPFPDACFDIAFGSMVMHHAGDHQKLGKQIASLLKPSGFAVFHENSARNPVLLLARAFLVGRFGIPRNSSPGEHPLRPDEINAFAAAFANKQVRVGRMVFFQLAAKYLCRAEMGLFFSLARRLDAFLYKYFPFLRWLSYYQILEFRAPARKEKLS